MDRFKEEVKNKVRMYSNEEYLDGYINNEYLTSDGDADIKLRLRDKSELFDYHTVGNQKELTKKFYAFIEEKSSMLDNNIQLNLHILDLDLTEKEKGITKHIIKEHYAIELYKVQREYRKIRKIIISLFTIGILSLLVYALIFYSKGSKFLIEVFGFVFSFALWKAIENIIYDVSKIKYQRDSIAQKLLMEIDFNNKKDDVIDNK